MSGLFGNPELVRNARISLRPNRMLLIAGICGVLSLVTGVALAHSHPGTGRNTDNAEAWDYELVSDIVVAQSLVFLVWGSLQCLLAVAREKDKDSWDFQRLTRLSAWKLTMGKLAGNLLVPLFIFACLIPAGFVGAFYWGHPGNYLIVLGIVIVGSLPYFAFALLLSVWINQRAAIGTLVLFGILMLFSGGTSEHRHRSLQFGSLGPFYSLSFLEAQHSREWFPPTPFDLATWRKFPADDTDPIEYTDEFLGIELNHLLVFAVVPIAVTWWLLFATKRNILRDPSRYRPFTPMQAVAFVAFLNFLFLGFFGWKEREASLAGSISEIATFECIVFLLFGFSLLRNRERTRGMIRDSDGMPGFLQAFWPASYVISAALIVEGAAVALEWRNLRHANDWSPGLALYAAAFFTAWALRDIAFLQWRGLTRSRRSLLLAFVYMAAFYVTTGVLFSGLSWYGADSAPKISFFVPSGVFAIDKSSWEKHSGIWIAGLAFQAATAAVFAALHWREIKKMAEGERSAEMPSLPAASITPGTAVAP